MNTNTASELSLGEAMELQKINEEYSNIKSIDDVNRLFTEGMYTLELCYNNFCKSVSLAEMKYYVKNGELLSEATGSDAKSIKDKIIEGFKKWVDKAIDFLTKLYRAARLKLIEIFKGRKPFLDKYSNILKNAKGTVTLDKGYENSKFDFHLTSEKAIEQVLEKAIKDDETSFDYMSNIILSLVCYGDTNHIKPDNIDATTFMHNAVYGEEKTNIKVSVSAAYNYCTGDFINAVKELDKIYLEMKRYSVNVQKSIESKYEASKKAYDAIDSNNSREKLIAKQATKFLDAMMAAYKIVIEYNNKLINIAFRYIHYKLRQAEIATQLYISDYYAQNKNESATVIETAVKDNFSELSIEDIFARVSTL